MNDLALCFMSGVSLPVAWEADGTVTPALSNAELQAILEEEEVGVMAGSRGRGGGCGVSSSLKVAGGG